MQVLYVYLPWGHLALRLVVTAGCMVYAVRRRTLLGLALTVSSAILLVTPLFSAPLPLSWTALSGVELGRAMTSVNWLAFASNVVFSVSLFAVLLRETTTRA
jgi:hypothetical protein